VTPKDGDGQADGSSFNGEHDNNEPDMKASTKQPRAKKTKAGQQGT